MIFRFGIHTFDPERLELCSNNQQVSVQPQVFSLLVFLIRNRDRVVTKDEIIDKVWDGRIVSDATLNNRINAARSALGDDGKKQSIIRTFPRRGFRFIAEVAEDEAFQVSTRHSARDEIPLSGSAIRPTIAVLPFNNLSGDPEQNYFSDGITEEFITALSHIRQFFVIARNSTYSYKDNSPDVRQVAKDLGVRYILEGSVQKSGDRIRISVQLINGETGIHIWAERYDRMFADIFEIQDEITTTVVGAILPELSYAEQQRSRHKSSDNLDAWDLYQRGIWHCWRDRRENVANAKQYFLRAIEHDTEFCLAYAFLAYVIWRSVVFRFTPTDALEEALGAAEKALTIDNSNAYAHWALGVVQLQLREHELALELFEQAIELNPSFAHAHQWLGWTLVYDKRPQEGIQIELEAQRLSPNDPTDWGKLLIQAQAKMNMKEFAEAEMLARRAKQKANNLAINCVLLASIGYTNNTDDRELIIRDLLNVDPEFRQQTIAEVFPFRHQEDIDIWVEGLRRAGLPEG